MSYKDEFEEYKCKPSGEEREATPEEQHAQDCDRRDAHYLWGNGSRIELGGMDQPDRLMSTQIDNVLCLGDDGEWVILNDLGDPGEWFDEEDPELIGFIEADAKAMADQYSFWAWVKSWRIWRAGK